MDAYSLLECTSSVSAEELKANYHRILLKVHPDKCNESTDKSVAISHFIRVQSAYKLLGNVESRAKYDSLLRQTKLQRHAQSLSANEDNLLNLYEDFELVDSVYERACERCGGVCALSKSALDAIFQQEQEPNDCSAFVVEVECDTCSIVLNVLVI